MGPARNSGVDNLLLLCLFHADLIDKVDQESNYPVALLREWKMAQLAEYDAAVTARRRDAGWRLSEQEAQEVVAKSEAIAVNVTADTIYVGGMGGGPLGGGGGGGVIGGGFAAPGGSAPTIILDGQPGRWPGGGGGGGGVMFNTAPTSAPVAEGIGYACAFDDVGEGVPGKHMDSEALRLSVLMFANYIVTERGLVHMIHGAWENWSVSQIPGVLDAPVLCVIEAGQMERGLYLVSVELRAPNGERRARKWVEVEVEQLGTLVRAPVGVTLSATVGSDDLGLWSVVVDAGGQVLGRIDLLVKQKDE
ncbi:MAG: hypothetical protein QM809_08915 [Gordonia sp. (in: high G+C Gram-positive bacteria)]|uniref:hypothetical protein n=1 Tax=Gordonia sp. (in: high G+C Gram-positive bacteria) TaxID=84139 RepID=UPI0039E62117